MGFETHQKPKQPNVTKSEAARANGKKGGRPKKTAVPAPDSAARPHVTAAELVKPTEPEKPTETQEPTEPIVPAEVLPALDNPFGLTPRELLMIDAYFGVAAFNATEAYRLAGFKSTPEGASSNAWRVMGKDRVQQELSRRLSLRRLELRGSVATDDEVLARATARARGDIRKLFAEDDPLAKLPDDVAVTVKAVTPTRYGRRIELYDAHRDDELLLKVSGKLTQRHEVKVTRALEDILEEAHQLHQAKQIEGTAA